MIPTYGLTHIALQVQDLDRSSRFYCTLFGAKEMYRTENFVQLQTPNAKDILVLEKADVGPNIPSGILHFGFRLIKPVAIEILIQEVKHAGGQVKESGEFVQGEPYIFFYDPDGYEIEVWYELIPPALSSFN
ncbi:MAG: VOC family protein [Saprospiraceae bacterium]